MCGLSVARRHRTLTKGKGRRGHWKDVFQTSVCCQKKNFHSTARHRLGQTTPITGRVRANYVGVEGGILGCSWFVASASCVHAVDGCFNGHRVADSSMVCWFVAGFVLAPASSDRKPCVETKKNLIYIHLDVGYNIGSNNRI